MKNVAIMGFGTIGSGVYDVISGNNKLLEEKLGDSIQVKKILDIRDFKDTEYEKLIVHDFKDIVEDSDIDIVVESMGGLSPAYEFVKDSILAKKHVVTSNKALVAAHGTELIALAIENGVNFLFEASVGGGIPVIRTLTQAYSGEYIKEISGILNGTTNYILTKMNEEGQGFGEALKKAQDLGYAERNPEADIMGHDTCRKIAILTSLATKKEVNYQEIYTEGITNIDNVDFMYAKKLGLEIKLFGSSNIDGGKIFSYVCPVMVNMSHPLFMVNDAFNGIMIEGNMLGKSMLYGSGAGKLPTASAVVADILYAFKLKDINKSVGWRDSKAEIESIDKTSHRYFVRFEGNDEEAKEHCERAFGRSLPVEIEGINEYAIVTGYMREKDFKLVLESLPNAKKFIRARF